MQGVRNKLSMEDIIDVLDKIYGIREEVDTRYGGFFVKATSETPAIWYDETKKMLSIEYPIEDEELPNPDSARFYPDLETADSLQELREMIRDYFGEDVLRKVEKECSKLKNAKPEPGTWYRWNNPYMDCLAEQTYEIAREVLAEELGEKIDELKKEKPKHYVLCDVPIIVHTDVYDEKRYDGVTEYTAYFPSKVFIIPIDKVKDKQQLECVIEKIEEPGEWWN